MRPAKPINLQIVVRTFEAIPELVTAGAFCGANALNGTGRNVASQDMRMSCRLRSRPVHLRSANS